MPHSFHDGSGVSLSQPPPKPKRDWSSLSHDYANVKVTPVTPGPEKASFDFPDPGGHSRQGSREETIKSSQFLDQQMAKLMARKTSGQDEVDGAMKYGCHCEVSSAEECADKYPGEQAAEHRCNGADGWENHSPSNQL